MIRYLPVSWITALDGVQIKYSPFPAGIRALGMEILVHYESRILQIVLAMERRL